MSSSAIPTATAPSEQSISWCLTAADGSVLEAENPDAAFYSASTIKLHVLLAALRAADAGSLDLDRLVPATRTFTGMDGADFTLSGDHLDPTHPADGVEISVDELAVRMIDRSSNEATDHLLQLLGLEAVAEVCRDLGLTASRAERLIGDASALAAGRTLETSPTDLVRILRVLVTGEGLSLRSRDLARYALRAQRIPIIAKALQADVPWGSKSGWVDGYRHDVAVIGDPDGADVRYLAVMTGGIERAQADARIREITRTLLPQWCTAA